MRLSLRRHGRGRKATLTPDTVLPLPLPGELVDHPDVVRAPRLPDECLGAMCGRVGPWQSAIPELSEPPPPPPPPPVRVIREGVEIVPPSAPEPPIVTLDEDPDDDPAGVHSVPDRTSRATLTDGPPVRMPPETVLPLKPMPDECLGAMCGRGGR